MEVNERPYPLSKVPEVPYRSRWAPIFSIDHKQWSETVTKTGGIIIRRQIQ